MSKRLTKEGLRMAFGKVRHQPLKESMRAEREITQHITAITKENRRLRQAGRMFLQAYDSEGPLLMKAALEGK